MTNRFDVTGEEGSSDGVLNAIHALTAAFDDLFPNVAMEDIISKVYFIILFFFGTGTVIQLIKILIYK